MKNISGVGNRRDLFILATAALIGCVGEGASKSSQSLTEVCTGLYLCEGPDDWFEAELTPEGSDCNMGDILLIADGSIEVPEDPEFDVDDFAWTGDTQSFAICMEGGGCIACDSATQEEAEGDQSGQCTGSQESCSSQSPGYCSEIRGCYLHTIYGSDHTAERFECRGSARSCDGFHSPDSCERQGCDWE